MAWSYLITDGGPDGPVVGTGSVPGPIDDAALNAGLLADIRVLVGDDAAGQITVSWRDDGEA